MKQISTQSLLEGLVGKLGDCLKAAPSKERQGKMENLAVALRFWVNVKILEPNECWLWNLYLDRAGYGSFSIKGDPVMAHRASWTLTFGQIPLGLNILHRCDNRACVNPNHLFLGTHLENMQDCRRKFRNSFGIKSPQSKLNDEAVKEIRRRYKPLTGGADSAKSLAAEFGVARTTIYHVKDKRSWAHVQ